MTCSSSVGLVIRCNNATSLVKSQLRRQNDVCCHFDVGGHGRAHGGRVPPVPRGGYALIFSNNVLNLHALYMRFYTASHLCSVIIAPVLLLRLSMFSWNLWKHALLYCSTLRYFYHTLARRRAVPCGTGTRRNAPHPV